MRLVTRSEIIDDKWNECILNAPIFRHYALTYFLDATAEKWQGLISDDYKWVWPLPIKSRLVSKVYQPLLAQQLGPFGSEFEQREFDQCMDFIQKNFWGFNMKFNESIYTDWVMNPIQHINVELDLDTTYENIEAKFNRNVRSNLKKANVSEVVVSRQDLVADKVVLLFEQGRGKKIGILNSTFYENVESIYKSFAEKEQAETWVAELNGEIIAGLMLLNTNKRLLNFFTGSNHVARKTGAMHLLMATIIKEYSEDGNVLDFEGSNDENLAYFYKSFGGVEKVYLQSHKKWNLPIKA